MSEYRSQILGYRFSEPVIRISETRAARGMEIKKSVSEALEALQDLVQPIRMAQANKFRMGPYLGLKSRIDELYTENTRPEERASDDASNSGASVFIPDISSESSSEFEGMHLRFVHPVMFE